MIERPTRRYELTIVSLMGTAAGLAVLGMVFQNLRSEVFFQVGMVASGVALLCTLASIAMASQIDRLHQVGAKRYGGKKYAQMRNWTRLKVASILLTSLLILTAIIVAAALFARVGILQRAMSFYSIVASISTLSVALVLNAQAAQFFSLRLQTERQNSGLDNVFLLLSLIGGSALALLGMIVAFVDLNVGFALFRAVDGVFFVMAGAGLAGVGLFISRSLPTLYALFYEERDYYKGKNYLSRTKSLVMPTMVAFSLLFLVLLLIFALQIGVVGLVDDVQRDALVLGFMVFIVLALLGTVGASVALSRTEDKAHLYRPKRSVEEQKELWVQAVSASLASLLFIVAGLLFVGLEFAGLKSSHWLDFLTFAILAALGPYGFYVAAKAKRVRNLEERFPDFLRDIAASHKAGLPLPTAVRIASNGEYGALTIEIKKMADQLSWDVPFKTVLLEFAERVNTPLVHRSTSLMIEASNSGGNITDVLLAAARDAREIKNLENERASAMGLYTAVIYLTFAVFMGVTVLMYRTFITDILAAIGASQAAGAASSGFQFSSLTLDQYRVFYFVAALMQGLGNGMIAGLMGTGRVLMGMRHSFIMVSITYFVFKVIA